ncbi:MAG: dimethyl sulfoxide reductase anchor subunit family protein [Bacteroidales bacterium]
MNSNEWPLVFFTLLTQISLGIIIAGLLFSLVIKNTETSFPPDLKKLLLITALGCMVVALAISFFHLASPLHSVYALSNIGTSWLSREILLASLLTFSLLIATTSLYFNVPHRDFFSYLFLASFIVGVILVWSMARIYMIETVPQWNTPSTPIAFFNTALMLGGSFTLVLMALYFSKNPVIPDIRPMQNIVFLMIAAAVFISLLNMLLIQPDVAAAGSGFFGHTVSPWWRHGQLILMLVGFSLLTYWFTLLPDTQWTASRLIYAGAACLLLAEILGRYLFYASYYRVGI